MAKVKCNLCGKKFELYANASVCPKCGCHYHEDGELSRSFEGSHEHGELHGHYDGGNYEHGHYDETGVEHKHFDGAGLDKKNYDGAGLNAKYDGSGLEHNRKNSYDANKVKRQYHERQKAGMGSISGVYENRNKTADTVSTNTTNAYALTKNDLKTGKRFVIFIFMIFVFVNFCNLYGKITDEIHKKSVEKAYESNAIEMDDIPHYDMGMWEYWTIEDIELCITDAFIISDNKVLAMYNDYPCGEDIQSFANYDWSCIPEGYEVVGYRYHLNSEEHSPYDFSKIATPYMVTSDGQYLKCVDAYYWDKIMTDLDAANLKDWVGYGMDQSDGVILFLLHEKTADHLMLDIRPDVLVDDSDMKTKVLYKMDIAPTKEEIDE